MIVRFEALRSACGFTSDDEHRLRGLPSKSAAPTALSIDFLTEEAVDGTSLDVRDTIRPCVAAWLQQLREGPWTETAASAWPTLAERLRERGAPSDLEVEVILRLRNHLLTRALESEPGRALVGSLLRAIDLDWSRTVLRPASLSELIGSIGHELRNPLTVIQTSTYMLRSLVPHGERAHGHLDRIAKQVVSATNIVSQLLGFVRGEALALSAVDVSGLILDSCESLERPDSVKLEIVVPPNLMAPADPVQLRLLIINLLQNAVQAASPGGRVRVECDDGPKFVTISIDDSGAGIAPSVRETLFHPFTTTKKTGFGLGLPLVQRVANAHGWTVIVGTGPLGGARFEVRMPKEAHAKSSVESMVGVAR
jgi:signal transduction histidine kinase